MRLPRKCSQICAWSGGAGGVFFGGEVVGQFDVRGPSGVGHQAADEALGEGGHAHLAGGVGGQFVAFGLYAPLRHFLSEQYGEVGRVDAHHLAQTLFQEKTERGRGNLRQKRRGFFDEFGLALLRVQIEAV